MSSFAIDRILSGANHHAGALRKKAFAAELRGITTDDRDLSRGVPLPHSTTTLKFWTLTGRSDKNCSLPHVQLFGISDGLELRVSPRNTWMIHSEPSLDKEKRLTTRGWRRIQFLCPIVKQVKTLNFIELANQANTRHSVSNETLTYIIRENWVDVTRTPCREAINFHNVRMMYVKSRCSRYASYSLDLARLDELRVFTCLTMGHKIEFRLHPRWWASFLYLVKASECNHSSISRTYP